MNEPHFDKYQFDPDHRQHAPGQVTGVKDRYRLPAEIFGEGEDQPDQFHITTLGRHRREHNCPDWALSDAGIARVCLRLKDDIDSRKRGNPVTYARRTSVAYLYFRLGLSLEHVARYLDLTYGCVNMLVHNMRQQAIEMVTDESVPRCMGGVLDKATTFVKVRQVRPSREPASQQDVSGAGTARDPDTKWRRLEAKEKRLHEMWNNMVQDSLVALGAGIRPRRKSKWNVLDEPCKTLGKVEHGKQVVKAARVINGGPQK